jgi:hypothetical protein
MICGEYVAEGSSKMEGCSRDRFGLDMSRYEVSKM